MRRVPTGIAALVLGSALLLACGNGDKGGDGGARDDRRDHRGKQRAYTLLDGRYTPIPEREGRIASIVVPGWYVRPAWLWGEPRTSVLDALAELIRG